MKITEQTTIGEIVENFENAQTVLEGFGMHCFSCPMSRRETLKDASAVHGIDAKFMIEKLKKDLVEKK